MRQAGVLAAAGLLALTDQVERLHQDHDNAYQLARGLSAIEGLDVDMDAVQTNMVFVGISRDLQPLLIEYMRQNGILMLGMEKSIRMVTHGDLSGDDVAAVVDTVKDYFASRRVA